MKRKNKIVENLIPSKEDNINININPSLNINSNNPNSNISPNKKETEKNNYSFQDTNKENIINDLKLKGFNEIQIDDILETLIRNSISDRSHLIEDRSNLNIQETRTIDAEKPLSIKIGINQNISRKSKKMENINNNSKYKNSFIIKTENSERKKNNNNKIKYNCAKIYINASSEKDRDYYLNSNDDINLNNNENENNGKIVNFKKYRNVPHITSIAKPTESKNINTRYGNYINKFCSQYNNINYNRNEGNKKEICNKCQNEMNNHINYKNQRNPVVYNNYNFKMIFDSKKYKNKQNTENIGYVEIINNSNREGDSYLNQDHSPPAIILGVKSRNSYKEENKNNNNNSFSIKQKILSSLNQISNDLKEIQEEEKENNEILTKDIKEIKENKEAKEYKDYEKHNKKKNKGKYNTIRKNEFKKEKKYKQDDTSNNINNNKFINTKKIFTSINNTKKEIPRASKFKKNNIFMIRKQKTEEEEKLAKKNIAIIEIKQNVQKTYRYNNNDINGNICDKYNKSKSLSKINNVENELKNNDGYILDDDNLKRSLSNYNHTFVNINLCKRNNIKNCSTFYKNRGNSLRENSYQKQKHYNYLNKEDLSIKEEEKKLLYNRINKVNTNSFTYVHTDDNNNSNDNNNVNNNSNKLNHILVTSYNLKCKNKVDGEDINNKSITNNNKNYTNKNNKNINVKKYINVNIKNEYKEKEVNKEKEKEKENEKESDKINIYLKKIKKYENGIYEGIMLNDKREIKGIMVYSNGAKYEGQWRNDKKNGKGIFTSSHYYNCKNSVGMKYEGEFKDDKFDGYGVTNYTNGDKFEGEWKDNKQYGRGVVSYLDGSKYDGEWREGRFNGLGTFYLKNGERFEGKFVDNKYNGYGKYYYNNGDYLEGIFKNDRPTGNCLLYKTDGQIIELAHN